MTKRPEVWERLERAEMRRRSWRPAARGAAPGERPDPSRPPGTDLLPQIRHVVVLMMENHSYDNYLGMLQGRGDGFPLGADGEPDVWNQGDGGERVRAHHLTSTAQRTGIPSQSWHATHHQWQDGALGGFVTAIQKRAGAPNVAGPDAAAAAEAAMGYWTEQDLPFYYGLARTFPLADRWFSSCLGPTFPNRRFLIAGTAHGLISDAPYDLLDYPPAGTIFDSLTENRISWANYRPESGLANRLHGYARHGRRMTRRRVLSAGRFHPSVAQGIQKDIQFTADVFPVGFGRYMRHVRSTDEFFADARDGTLPAFSIVDPDFREYSEENPQDVQRGESFAAEVISAVMHGRGWPGTLLIWVYDEHGGYYDHVPPPAAVPPDDVTGRSLLSSPTRLQRVVRRLLPGEVAEEENLTEGPVRYDRYGFRVPAVLVSPFARPDFVSSEVFDHTSVLRLASEKWNLPALTRRDAAATAPLGLLDLAGPPAFADPPELPEPALKWGTW